MFFEKKFSTENRAILITGCDSGFGNHLALTLNRMGFRVYATVLDPNSTGAQQLSIFCKTMDKMIVMEMDVTNEEQINRCYERVATDMEKDDYKLWAVVNNAGYLVCGHLMWGTFDEYKRVFDVNVFGVVRVTRKFLPLMRESQGRIVITASYDGRMTFDNLGAYCMTKYSVISFSDALRREMKKFKVKVSTIEPGLFMTLMYYNFMYTFEKSWTQTDECVRNIYGEKYYQDQIKVVEQFLRLANANSNLDIVINDMIDAITSKNPKSSYKPLGSILGKLVSWFSPIAPQWIIDRCFYFLDNTKPAFMKKDK